MTAVMLFCTNKGRHKRQDLSSMSKVARIGAKSEQIWLDDDAGGLRSVGKHHQTVKCPDCGRSPEMRRATLLKLYDGLNDAGVSEADISFLHL